MDKTTPLYQLHIGLNAKMVAFAGYQMPIQYPMGIIKEAEHCRNKVGLFDVSHMGQFELSLDAANELDKLVVSNVAGLSPGQQVYTVMTNAEGGIIDDVIVTRLSSKLLLVVNADCKEKDFHHLNSHLSEHCQLRSCTERALLALQGPLASNIMAELAPTANELSFMTAAEVEIEGLHCIVSRSGYTGEDGFEISIANDKAEQLVQRLLSFEPVMPIGLGARDILRLEAGLSLYGHELTETISPVEAGLTWLLKKQSDYLGSEKIRYQLEHGTDRQKVALLIEGKIPVRHGAEVLNGEGQIIGHITSGSFSPTLQQSIALAQIDSTQQNTTLFAQIRNHKISMKPTRLPFVAHQYKRK